MGISHPFAAQAAARKNEDMRLEVLTMMKLIEERAMQLAHADRPKIEGRYTKIELNNYKNMFNRYSIPGPPRAVEIANMKPLLRKCCDLMRDSKTKKWLNSRNINRVVSIFDVDASGKIEWAEFLEINWELRQKKITDIVTDFFGENVFGFSNRF